MRKSQKKFFFFFQKLSADLVRGCPNSKDIWNSQRGVFWLFRGCWHVVPPSKMHLAAAPLFPFHPSYTFPSLFAQNWTLSSSLFITSFAKSRNGQHPAAINNTKVRNKWPRNDISFCTNQSFRQWMPGGWTYFGHILDTMNLKFAMKRLLANETKCWSVSWVFPKFKVVLVGQWAIGNGQWAFPKQWSFSCASEVSLAKCCSVSLEYPKVFLGLF